MLKYLVVFLLSLVSLSSCSLYQKDAQKKTPNNSGALSEEIQEEKTQTEVNADIVQKKINDMKKRLALKWLIIEWDNHYSSGELPLALKKYLDVYRKNPDDILIVEKIWNTYFKMHNYESALLYFKKIPDTSPNVRKKILLAEWYSAKITDQEGIRKLRDILSKYKLSKEEGMYYLNSLNCQEDFIICKQNFETYFSSHPLSDTASEVGQTEALDQEHNEVLKLSELRKLAEAFENYKNFGLDDESFKDAYIVGAYYSNELYPLAIELGKKVLLEKTDYRPVLKIIAQSYFTLGDYKNARSYLSQYYEQNNEDPAVAYMLGIINNRLGELVLSNIYFQRALKLGYTPSLDIRRQLVHNYYTLWDQEKMLQAFSDIVEKEPGLEAIDLSLGIYYMLWDDQYRTALKWITKGKELFPENGNFYAYHGWILREQWNIEDSNSILKAWLDIDHENTFLLINLGYNAREEKSNGKALIYFKKVLRIAPNSDFGKQAKQEIRSISEEQKQ